MMTTSLIDKLLKLYAPLRLSGLLRDGAYRVPTAVRGDAFASTSSPTVTKVFNTHHARHKKSFLEQLKTSRTH
jgi:hypothetical protein